MAFLPGLKKQFNKANQFMTERITGKLKRKKIREITFTKFSEIDFPKNIINLLIFTESGVEGTKLDNEFQDMEKRTDLFNEMVNDLQLKTKEFLQPDPTVRVKMSAVKGISKLSGQAKASTYPQPEGTLGN